MTSTRIKLIYATFFLSLISSLLVNFQFERWFFLGVSILSLAIFLLLLGYSVIEFVIEKEPIDLWKVGFIGLLGVIGIIPGLTPFFGMFVFFAFFGSRNYY